MATTDLTSGFVNDAISIKGSDKDFVMFREIDCAVTPLVSGDTYNLFNIPAGTLILAVAYEVVTPEGAADTADFGFTGTLAGFYNDASMNATAGTKVGTYVTPLFFGTDTKFTLLPNAALGTLKLRVWVACVNMAFV